MRLAGMNTALAEQARYRCGTVLADFESNALDAAHADRDAMLAELDSLGYKVQCPPNVWHARPLAQVLREWEAKARAG